MKQLFVFLAVISFSQFDSATAQTWIQWRAADGGNNHYYALTTNATSWIEAEEIAESWGGTLATITSSREQEFINTNILTGSFEHLPVWIGLANLRMAGSFSRKWNQIKEAIGWHSKVTFAWITGESFDYANWKSGEPSNNDPGEYFVAINWEYSDVPPRGVKGDWNDAPMEGTRSFGGATDGPYFGLVERNTDSSPSIKSGFDFFNWKNLALVALLFAGTFAFLFRKRRRNRASQALHATQV